MRSFYLSLVFLFFVTVSFSQGRVHSHNDYTRPRPFYDAISVKAFSIEADIFLRGDSLYVAHTEAEIKPGVTLDKLYLLPIQKFFDSPDFYSFQLMIDIKTDWAVTYPVLLKALSKYKKWFQSEIKRVNIVISGNRPPAVDFRKVPEFIWFDGSPGIEYSAADLNKVLIVSDNFKNYTNWNGEGEIPAADREKLEAVVAIGRRARKSVRFWNTPDTEATWRMLIGIGAYTINTDKLEACSAVLKSIK